MIRRKGGPVAINSEFGWVVSGPTNDKEEFSGESVVNLSIEKPRSLSIPNSQATSENDLSKSLHRFWEVESLGITEEHAAEEEFLRGVHYHHDEGRYEINLVLLQSRTVMPCV